VKTLFSFLMATLSQFLSMQGDQMSLWKNRPLKSLKRGLLFQVNNCLIVGGNSPNLVTLLPCKTGLGRFNESSRGCTYLHTYIHIYIYTYVASCF
jgi:hypothetical protein